MNKPSAQNKGRRSGVGPGGCVSGAVQPLQGWKGFCGVTQGRTAGRSYPGLDDSSPSGLGSRPGNGRRLGGRSDSEKNRGRLLTRCLTSNTVYLTNPSRLSLDRRTRTGALFVGARA
jgi:hypothetical protein